MKAIYTFLAIIGLMITTSGCHQEPKGKTNTGNIEQKTDSIQISKTSGRKTTTKMPSSFVVSCGSGCAMTYTPTKVTRTLPQITVSFKVEMNMNEQLSDTYTEVYIFSYDPSDRIRTIHLNGKEENVLTTSTPSAQRSFSQFAADLIQNNIDKRSAASKIIYEQRTDPTKAVYKTIKTSLVKGLEKYSCNEADTRYLPLPSPGSIRLILVPQDCGDMSYRYYLIAIKNGQVTGDLYVEGEWYEPEGEDEKEIRHFAIADNFQVTVTISTAEHSVVERYRVEPDGTIVKDLISKTIKEDKDM